MNAADKNPNELETLVLKVTLDTTEAQAAIKQLAKLLRDELPFLVSAKDGSAKPEEIFSYGRCRWTAEQPKEPERGPITGVVSQWLKDADACNAYGMPLPDTTEVIKALSKLAGGR